MENTSNYLSNTATSGLNTDLIPSQLQPGMLTYARNAVVANFDGRAITYQNEQGNELHTPLKDNFKVIGLKNIIEQDITVLFLVDPGTKNCEIGQRVNSTGIYTSLINSPCLSFSIDHPIRKIIVKTSNCNKQIFWTDGINPRRYLDLDDLPISNNGKVDCNKLLLQPNFSIPIITPLREDTGGSLLPGSYQFGIQYANSLGEGYTSFFSITNPVGIYVPVISRDFNIPTTKSISIKIEDLDTTGIYDYFNLVVIEAINQINEYKLVGTFPIIRSDFQYTYTGNTKDLIRLSAADISEAFPYYDTAQDVTVTDNTLVWVDVAIKEKMNYQNIWSQVKLLWETYKIPDNEFEGYSNGINSAKYRSHMRDEVYAIEGCFVLKSGQQTAAFHIPGPIARPHDLDIVSNLDSQSNKKDPCDPDVPKKRWQVYNTATRIGYTEEYKKFLAGGPCQGCPPNSTNDLREKCYVGSYEYGEFAYWESSEKYPENALLWGDLAGTPIRHHLFPDNLTAPIYKKIELPTGETIYTIYPLGIRVDADSLYKAIAASDLTQEQKDQIVGFKILRADRTSHQSCIAKGLLFNVGKYERDGKQMYYQNYPYNDLRKDPYLSSAKVTHHTGENDSSLLNGFGQEAHSLFTFHSPETHFAQPYLINSGLLKIETVEYGKSKGHFVPVQDNAKYKFLTTDAMMIAWAAGFASILKLEIGGGFGLQAFQAQAGLDTSNVIPAFQSTMELLKNLAPSMNYAMQYNSIGNYSESHPIPNDTGNKIRNITLGNYLLPGVQSIQGNKTINNYKRESAVLINIDKPLPFPHQISPDIPIDNSRHLPDPGCDDNKMYNRDICAFYGTIKRIIPDQYGRIYDYTTIDTGFYQQLHNSEGANYKSFATVFGGDTYINRMGLKKKMPFFISDTVTSPDQSDVSLDLLSNVSYPIYYYSTRPIELGIDFGDLKKDISTITDTAFGNIVANLVSGGTRPMRAGFSIFSKFFGAYVNTLGKANVNLNCRGVKDLVETGKVYFYSYGIPYFYCESTVNLAYRQAVNDKEGNFYPFVGTDIPDYWLQEVNVPIIHDNQFNYNRTYSSQNKVGYFDHLREDYDPKKICFTHFPNRAIYSQKSNLEETKNNWMIYRPASYYSLPKIHGKVMAVDGLEDNKILVRFENKSLLYNVLSTINTGTGEAYIGNPGLFSQPPLDFSDTETGFAGTSHKLLIKSPAGHLTVDVKRGQILLFSENRMEDVSAHGMSAWFRENLWLRLKKQFPTINEDNHFNGIGITGIYDAKYKRFLITKKDFQPLISGITYKDGQFRHNDTVISIYDKNYFCNISWTISYSIITNSWTSQHSYIPDFYIAHPDYFETGIQSKGIFTHNKSLSFNTFYGKIEDYILEYPLVTGAQEEILTSFCNCIKTLRYHSPTSYTEANDIYYTKAVIYNDSQCTGMLNLIYKPAADLSIYRKYPILKETEKDILLTKTDGKYCFNTFWDTVKDKTKPFYSVPCTIASYDKVFDKNLDYSHLSYRKAKIRGKDNKIRLIYSSSSDYKLVSEFTLTETQKSQL